MQNWSERAHHLDRLALRAAVVLLVAVTTAALAARWHWSLDLCSHFRVQWTVLGALALLWAALERRWWIATAAGACAVVHAIALWPLYGARVEAQATPDLRIASVNLYSGNRDFASVRRYLEDSRPDVVVLLELTPQWATALIELNAAFPHRLFEPRPGNFGIGVLSRRPLELLRPDLQDRAIPLIACRVKEPGSDVTLVAVHAYPPLGANGSRERNGLLQEVADLAGAHVGPVVVAGDLNITPWSPHFHDLLLAGDLRDCRAGFGVQATWPVHRWPLQIPIDHCLVSPELTPVWFTAGPDIGSDHRPVLVELKFNR